MHYYVDGYNLLFRLRQNHEDLATRRQLLIEDLAAKVQFLELDITLIFDSQYQPDESSRSHVGNLEIVFTDHGETADDRILDEVKANAGSTRCTVVTSDKKLAWFSRRCSAATEPVEHFIIWLNKRYKNKLRHKNEPAKAQVLKTPAAPKKPLKPIRTAKAEECGNYYQTIFEAELAKQQAEIPPKPVQKQRTRRKPKVEPPPEDELEKTLLDNERWLRIFERKLRE